MAELSGVISSRSRMVVVAQLVERWLVVPDVAGSSPVSHPLYLNRIAETDSDLREQTIVAPDVPWTTTVWNDPVNLMSYVTHVFRNYFGHPKAEAERLMLLVHHEGRAVVATGPREEMERHTEAMHEYGLWATVDKAPQ
jgi:ATP-dependent Clp protease adaptor protein ClpS